MQSQCVVKLRHDVRGGLPEDRTQPLDRGRPDLFGLSLGVLTQTGPSCDTVQLVGLDHDCVVSCGNITTVRTSSVSNTIGLLFDDQELALARAMSDAFELTLSKE